MNELPAVGTWVRVRTNTTPSSLTVLGCVVLHRERVSADDPLRAVVMNLQGGWVVDVGQIVATLTVDEVVRAAGTTTERVMEVARRLMGEAD